MLAKSSREILETAIRESPHDKAPYAAYADFLMEQGDPQGEFMQVQLALEDESLDKAERKKLQAKEAELQNTYQRQWLGSMAPILIDLEGMDDFFGGNERYPVRFRFTRGLWTELEYCCFNIHLSRIFVACPEARFLQKIAIGTIAYQTPDSYAVESDLQGAGNYPATRILANWKHWNQIRAFRVGSPENQFSTPNDYFSSYCSGVIANEAIKLMPNVEEVYLFAQGVYPNGIFSARMPNLRVLHLFHETEYPLELLANNPSITQLRTLLCHPHAIDHGGTPSIRIGHIQALVRSPYLKNLRHLRLSACDAGDDGIREFLHNGFIKQLEILDLGHGRVSDEGAQLLAQSGLLRPEQQLYLHDNALTVDGITALQATGVQLFADQQNQDNLSEDQNYAQYLFQGDAE